jgi:hypothetical protein
VRLRSISLRIARVLVAALLVVGAAATNNATLSSARTVPAEREEDIHLPELSTVELAAKLARAHGSSGSLTVRTDRRRGFRLGIEPQRPLLSACPPSLSRYSVRRQI